jgi:hypothetical protein
MHLFNNGRSCAGLSLRRIDIKAKIAELGIEMPPYQTFERMGNLLALRQRADLSFYRSNFERGILLYALVAYYKPKVILEFGTGRGYGAFSMARALCDFGLEGSVYTIDSRTYTQGSKWEIDFSGEPEVRFCSWAEVWPKYINGVLRDRVICLNGLSAEVMRRWCRKNLPRVDFCFLDGGHDYLTVKEDFYSFINVSSSQFAVLFDDYAVRPGFGICKFADEEVTPTFQAELIYTDRRWYGGEYEHHAEPDYGMLLIDSRHTEKDIASSFSCEKVKGFLEQYRRSTFLRRQEFHLKSSAKRFLEKIGMR